MAITTHTSSDIEKSYTGTDDGGDVRVFINTSNSFDTWRKFTNQIGSDLENLMVQVDDINNLGAPANNPGITGTATINNIKIGGSSGREFNALLINQENPVDNSANDNKIVSARVVAKQKAALTSSINLKANKASPAFTNSGQLTHTGDTIFKVKTTGTTTDAEIRIGGGINSGKAILAFQDTATPNGKIEVDVNGNFTITGESFTFTAGKTISGKGSGLTNLNASNISSGTIADARIPSTITRDSELQAFTGTANISTLGTITTGIFQGTAIAAAYIGSLPASKITSGTFANARISQSSVTQHQSAITSVGTLTGLTINSANNVTAAKAPTNGNHLTNKTYVDAQVATKDNYDHFGIRAEGGAITDISSNETINFTSGDTAITFTRTGNTIGLDLDLGDLTATHGTLPSASLPDLTVSDFADSAFTDSSESFDDSDSKFMTAKSINDRIGALITANLSGAAIGGSVFVRSISNPTSKGLNIGTADATTGDVTLSLDFSNLDANHAPIASDDLVFQDAGNAVPKKRAFSSIPLTLFDHANQISLSELSDVADGISPSANSYLKYDGTEYVVDTFDDVFIGYNNVSDRIRITTEETGNTGTRAFPLVQHHSFLHSSTRKAGIHFGRSATGSFSSPTSISNDPGLIVHECGIVENDNNKSIIHLSPGDDTSNPTSSTNRGDLVWIHGYNQNHGTAAASPSGAISSELHDGQTRPHYNDYTGLELHTGGEIRGITGLRFNAGTDNGTTRGTDEEYGLFKSCGLLKLGKVNSATDTTAIGSEIRLQHPGTNADGNHWKIRTDSRRTDGADDLHFVLNDTGDNDSSGQVGLRVYGNSAYRGTVSAPATDNSKIDGVGNKALPTVEWVNNAINAAVAPISKPDILRFRPEGHITVRTETSASRTEDQQYWERDNGFVKIHFDNLNNWAIREDRSLVPDAASSVADGKYFIEVGLTRQWAPTHNSLDDITHRKFVSSSDNPSATYFVANDVSTHVDRGGAQHSQTYILTIHDRISGRQTAFRFHMPSGGNATKTYGLEDLDTAGGWASYGNLFT